MLPRGTAQRLIFSGGVEACDKRSDLQPRRDFIDRDGQFATRSIAHCPVRPARRQPAKRAASWYQKLRRQAGSATGDRQRNELLMNVTPGGGLPSEL